MATTTISSDLTIDTDTFYVDSVNGRVGVGTTSPTHTLEIDGSLWADSFRTDETTNHTVFVGDDAGLNSSGTWAVFVGEHAGANNLVDYANGFGSYTLQNNSGTKSNGFGHFALQNNSGMESSGFGYNALQNNTGNYSNGFGNYALRSNLGAGCNGVGEHVLRKNTGNFSSAFGHFTLYYNSGANSSSFGYYGSVYNSGADSSGLGYYTLHYNQGAKNTAVGSDSFNTFTNDTGSAKTFVAEDCDPETEQITITSHGFGSNGTYVNLKVSTNGILPAGLDAEIDNWLIVDANTLDCRTDSFTDGGSGIHILTPQVIYTNSTAIGYNTEPDASNQIMLGDVNVTEVKTTGSIYSSGSGDNYFAGNTGIGTTSPAVKLDVNGLVKVHQTASTTCSALLRGSMFYNEDNDSFWGCKSSGWVKLDN